MKRVSNLFRLTTTSALFLTAVLALGQTPNPALPTLFLAGDSTAADGTPETMDGVRRFRNISIHPRFAYPTKPAEAAAAVRLSLRASGSVFSRS